MFEPTAKPLAAVAVTLLNTAVALEIEAVPSVVLPTVNVTVPVMVPTVVELTVAVTVVVPPTVTEFGFAKTVVLVVAGAAATTVTIPLPDEGANVALPP